MNYEATNCGVLGIGLLGVLEFLDDQPPNLLASGSVDAAIKLWNETKANEIRTAESDM